MPCTQTVGARRDAVDREVPGPSRHCVIGVIENQDIRLAPRMQLVNHLELRGLLQQLIEGNHLAVVVERSNANNFAAGYVDDLVAVHNDIRADHVQRPSGDNCLEAGHHYTVLVLQLEAALQRNWSAFPDVGEPDGSTGDAVAASLNAAIHDGLSAPRLIGGELND